MKKIAAILALGLFAIGCGEPAPPPSTSAPLSHSAPGTAHEMTNEPAVAPATDPVVPATTDPAAPAVDPAAPAADAPAAPANP